MKIRLSLFALLLCTSTYVFATPSIFFDGTWEQARAKAKKENKYIFLDCWTEWCGYCKMMDSETFVDSAVVEFMNKNFVSVSRDMERGEGRLLNMKYHTQGYPTYYIFNPQGQLCFELIGYMKPQPWIDTLQSVLRPENQHVCTGFSAELEPGYPEFYKASFGPYKEKKSADSAEAAIWLDKQPDPFSEICWGVLWLSKGNDKQQQWIFDNREKLYALYGEQVWHTIAGIIAWESYQARQAENDSLFEQYMNMATQYLPEPYRTECIYYARSGYYEKFNQWREYALISDSFFQKSNYKDIQLNNLAWKVYENTSDSVALNIAVKWMKYELLKDSSWYVHDTYACLLFKTGRLEEAEREALIAIELAGKEGDTADDTRKLLEAIREQKKKN